MRGAQGGSTGTRKNWFAKNIRRKFRIERSPIWVIIGTQQKIIFHGVQWLLDHMQPLLDHIQTLLDHMQPLLDHFKHF